MSNRSSRRSCEWRVLLVTVCGSVTDVSCHSWHQALSRHHAKARMISRVLACSSPLGKALLMPPCNAKGSRVCRPRSRIPDNAARGGCIPSQRQRKAPSTILATRHRIKGHKRVPTRCSSSQHKTRTSVSKSSSEESTP